MLKAVLAYLPATDASDQMMTRRIAKERSLDPSQNQKFRGSPMTTAVRAMFDSSPTASIVSPASMANLEFGIQCPRLEAFCGQLWYTLPRGLVH
ncbi:hypothetical protein N7494_009518 [Penicillium frequentans]|uniref:Uncharacterized protein n=1 Tax=Penicillium frequentans TaxID=3151616 RepID=A0AAD6CSL5_9EURO|nr:hypothetical protein N7494_009518 [Penicillium glabrum]